MSIQELKVLGSASQKVSKIVNKITPLPMCELKILMKLEHLLPQNYDSGVSSMSSSGLEKKLSGQTMEGLLDIMRDPNFQQQLRSTTTHTHSI